MIRGFTGQTSYFSSVSWLPASKTMTMKAELKGFLFSFHNPCDKRIFNMLNGAGYIFHHSNIFHKYLSTIFYTDDRYSNLMDLFSSIFPQLCFRGLAANVHKNRGRGRLLHGWYDLCLFRKASSGTPLGVNLPTCLEAWWRRHCTGWQNSRWPLVCRSDFFVSQSARPRL